MSGEDNHEWFDNPEQIGQSISLGGQIDERWYSYQFTSNKDGTIFAVSDPTGNENVKIYEYNASSNCGQGGYEQKGSTISNPNQYVQFGTNIKFNDEGTILFVSAPGDNYNYNAEIYVYEWNPSSNCGQGGWDQKGEKITGSHYQEGAALICNKEGTIIAYNIGYGSSNVDEKVFVQEWNPSSNCGQGGWEQKGGNIDIGTSNDGFGSFMDMNGDGTIIVIGAYKEEDGGTDKGVIYVYEWNPSSNCGQGGWEQRGSTNLFTTSDVKDVGGRVCINSDGTFIVSMFQDTATLGGASHVFCVWEWNPSSNCGQGGYEQKGDINYSSDRKYNNQIFFMEHSDGPKISDDGMYIFIPEYRHDTGNTKNEAPVGGGFKLYTWDQTSNCGQGDWGIVSEFSIDDDPYFCRFTTLSNDGTVVGTWSSDDVKFYKLAEPRSTGEDELGDWGATINLAQVISSTNDFAITGAINRHGNMFAFQDSPTDNIWIYKSTEEDSGINGGWNYTLHEKIGITGQQSPGNKLEMDWTGRNILYFNYGQEKLTLYRGDSFQISETRYSTDNTEFLFPFDSTVYENKGEISGVRTFGIARSRNSLDGFVYEMIAYITGTEVKIAEYNGLSIYNGNTFENPTTWTFESLSNPGTFETTLNIGAVSASNKTYSGDALERGIALSGNGEFLAVCDASVTPEIIHLFKHTGSGKWTRFKDKDGGSFFISDMHPYTNDNSKGRFGEFLCWDRFGNTLLVSDYGANNNDSGGDGSIWIYDLEWNPTTSNGDNATANGYSGGVIKNKAVINKNYGTGGRPWATSWGGPPTLSEDGNRITFGGNYHDGDGFLAIYDRANNDFVEVPGHNIAPDNFQSYFDNVSSDLPVNNQNLSRWGAWSVLLSHNGETIVTPMRNAKRDSNYNWVNQLIALDVSEYTAPGEGYVVGDPVITEWLDEAVQLGDALPDPTLQDENGNALTADIHTLHELSGDGKSIIVAHINLSGTGEGGGNDVGKVNVYEWDESSNCGQGGWSQKGDDINLGFFSASAMDLAINYDGSIVAVGMPNDADGKGGVSGHLRTFQWNASSNCGQGGWERIEISGELVPDGIWFAASIAMNYDGTIIAATLGNQKMVNGGDNDGIITYEWNASSNCGQGGWEEKGRISAAIDFNTNGWLNKNTSLNMNKDGTMIAFNVDVRSEVYEWNASSNCGQGGWEEKADIPDAYFPKMNDDGSIIAYILSNKGHRSVKVVEWNASANCGQGEYDLNGKGTAIDINEESLDCIELNNDGTILVVGEWEETDGNDKSNGMTTVYKWNASSNCGQGDWDVLLTISGNEASANFGRAISLSSNGGILSFQQNKLNLNLGSEEADTEPIFIYKLGNEGSGGGGGDSGSGDSGGGDSGSGEPPPDTSNPVITLNGSNPTNVNVGETYTELATASDNNDGDITSDIVITGLVNTSVSGSYTLTYNVKDAADNSATEVTRTVIVADTTNPVITLNGSNPTNVNVGETYTELATASDNNDGNITSDIVITGSVNTSVSGSYTLTYNVKDAADNSATEVTRTVVVKIPGTLIENLQVPTTFTIKDDYIYIFNGLTKKIVRYDMDGNLDNSNLVQLTKNATDMIFDSQNNLIVSEENGDILKIANVWKQGTSSEK